jgi:hypothetical protein
MADGRRVRTSTCRRRGVRVRGARQLGALSGIIGSSQVPSTYSEYVSSFRLSGFALCSVRE